MLYYQDRISVIQIKQDKLMKKSLFLMLFTIFNSILQAEEAGKNISTVEEDIFLCTEGFNILTQIRFVLKKEEAGELDPKIELTTKAII